MQRTGVGSPRETGEGMGRRWDARDRMWEGGRLGRSWRRGYEVKG